MLPLFMPHPQGDMDFIALAVPLELEFPDWYSRVRGTWGLGPSRDWRRKLNPNPACPPPALAVLAAGWISWWMTGCLCAREADGPCALISGASSGLRSWKRPMLSKDPDVAPSNLKP